MKSKNRHLGKEIIVCVSLLRVVAQIPWRTNIVLMEKLDTQESREWYAEKTIINGWSKTNDWIVTGQRKK